MRALRDRRADRVKFSRRHFLHLTAGAVALPAMLRLARAQTYAARPVHLIVGWPPGGAADLLARLIGQPLSQRLGQPLIIENRPGAGSNIATEAVVRAVPNGSTLLHVSSVNAFNATLYRQPWLQFCPRHRAGREPVPRTRGLGGAPVVPSEIGARVDHLCQGQSR